MSKNREFIDCYAVIAELAVYTVFALDKKGKRKICKIFVSQPTQLSGTNVKVISTIIVIIIVFLISIRDWFNCCLVFSRV